MKTRQAHASIILLNYLDRGGSDGLSLRDVVRTTEPMLLDKDVMSISVVKQKSAPAGRFEFSLAPSKNWVTHITPGSWVIIHMAPRLITKSDLESSSIETLKMIGRIDSVRVSVNVDSTGARNTVYRVQGRDWGQIFESSMYIDPAASFSSDSGVAQANKLGLDMLTNINMNKKENHASTTSLIEFIIKLFAGQGLDNLRKTVSDAFTKGADQMLPQYVYKVPTLLKDYANLGSDGSLTSSLKIIPGKLVGYDKYDGKGNESVGVPLYHMFIGNNMLWQLINEHSCNVINETIAELRWEKGKPSFCLYKRVKPFLVDTPGEKIIHPLPGVKEDVMKQYSEAGGSGAGASVQSSFFNVKRANIDLGDVIQLEMGNNWQDSANFVELMPDPSFVSMPTGQNAVSKTLPGMKAQSNEYDAKAWARDGFRPMMFNTKFFPVGSNGLIDISGQIKWLPTIKKWYFDTHKMLNGTVTIIGQNQYIGVGDNIMFPSVAAGYTNYISAGQDKLNIASEKTSNILGHIESISHTFTVQSNGARSFLTTVNFCRGVITNKSGNSLIEKGSYGIDTDARKMKESSKKHTNVTGGDN